MSRMNGMKTHMFASFVRRWQLKIFTLEVYRMTCIPNSNFLPPKFPSPPDLLQSRGAFYLWPGRINSNPPFQVLANEALLGDKRTLSAYTLFPTQPLCFPGLACSHERCTLPIRAGGNRASGRNGWGTPLRGLLYVSRSGDIC